MNYEPTLVLIAQLVFLSESRETDTQTHKIEQPTHITATFGLVQKMAINVAIITTTKTHLKCLNIFHDVLILQHVRYLHLLDFLERNNIQHKCQQGNRR